MTMKPHSKDKSLVIEDALSFPLTLWVVLVVEEELVKAMNQRKMERTLLAELAMWQANLK